jgi:hypothetical protein
MRGQSNQKPEINEHEVLTQDHQEDASSEGEADADFTGDRVKIGAMRRSSRCYRSAYLTEGTVNSRLAVPMLVIALVVVEAVEIIVQHISIARRQSLVVGGFFERINDVVQKAVVEPALIEVGLHFAKLILGPVETCIFFFTRVWSTPDMIKI